MSRFFVFIVACFIVAFPVFAQEDDPTRDHLNSKLSEISDKLDDAQKHHFTMLYSNYMLIGTVKAVQESVSKAIASCGEKNPDMKTSLDGRMTQWNDAVNPILSEALGSVNNMVLAQDYAPKEEIDSVLKQIDETRAYADSQVSKVPVTTPEACTFLMDKMDGTQTEMTEILRRTLTPAAAE